MGRVLSALGLVLTLLVGMGLAQEKNASYWFDKAFRERDTDKKIEYYQKSIQLDSHDPEAHNNLGILYKKKGMYAEAIREYEAALAIPGYKTPEYAYHNLGMLYKDRAMFQQAVEYLKKALQANPNFAKSYNALGLAYKGLGRYEEAAQSFKQALKINPNYVQANYNLQNLWRLSEEDTEAKRQAEILYDEGIGLLEQRRFQAALAKFQEVLKHNPEHIGVKEKVILTQKRIDFDKLYKQGNNLIAKRRWKEAAAYFEQALAYAVTEKERQQIAARQREISFQIQLQAKKTEVDKLYQSGLNSLNDQDWLKAISKFTKILMLDPENRLAQEKNNLAKVGYYYEKGLESLKAQRWQDAEVSFNDLLKIEPRHAGAQEQLKVIAEHYRQEKFALWVKKADQARKLGNLQAAKQMYQNILELDANHAGAKAGLAQLQQQIQKEAEPGIATRIISYLTNPMGLISLIITVLVGYLVFAKIIRPSQVIKYYSKYKEYDKARTIYEKILEKDDNRRNIYPALANTYTKLKRSADIEHLVSLCEQKIQQEAESETPLWLLCLGEIYIEQGKLNEAQEKMELAYKKQPDNQEIQQKLAKLYETILSICPKDIKIATKLENLKAKLAAAAQKEEKANPSRKKIENKTEDPALNLLKECFGHNKS
jgi:tetratricopeptide (TPR) repeat protein